MSNQSLLINPEIKRPELPPFNPRAFDYEDNKPGIHGFVSAKVRHFLGIDEETGQKLYGPWNQLKRWIPKKGWTFWNHNLVTDVGEDYIIAQIWTNDVAGGVGSNFIALSVTSLTPAASDTALSGEITSGTNAGLARVKAPTRTHTTGSNTATLSNTFTSSATLGAPGVQSSALFNALSSGTMQHIQNLPAASGAMATNDQISVSWLNTSARP